MSCSIKRDKSGAITSVLDFNGKESILFQKLLERNNNKYEQSMQEYLYAYTTQFKSYFGFFEDENNEINKFKLYENGEPRVEYIPSLNERNTSPIIKGINPEFQKMIVDSLVYKFFETKRLIEKNGKNINVGNILGRGSNPGSLAISFLKGAYTNEDGEVLDVKVLTELAKREAAIKAIPENTVERDQAIKEFDEYMESFDSPIYAEFPDLIADEFGELSEKELEARRELYFNVYNNWDTQVDRYGNENIGWRDLVKNSISSKGLDVVETSYIAKDSFNDDIEIDLSEDIETTNRLHGKNRLEEDPFKTVSNKMKELLGTIPASNKNILGFRTFISPEDVYAELSTAFANKTTFQGMLVALKNLAAYKPQYKDILNFFNGLTRAERAGMVYTFGLSHKQFLATKILDDGDVLIYNPAKSNIENSAAVSWRDQSVSRNVFNPRSLFKVIQDPDGEDVLMLADPEAGKRIFDNYKTVIDAVYTEDVKITTEKNNVISPSVEALAKLLWDMSIQYGNSNTLEESMGLLQKYFNEGVITLVKNSTTGEIEEGSVKGKELYKQLVFPPKEGHGDLKLSYLVSSIIDFTTVGKVRPDKFVGTKKQLKNFFITHGKIIQHLASPTKYLNSAKVESFRSPSGKSIYPNNLMNHLDFIVNTLTGVDGSKLLKEYLSDPFLNPNLIEHRSILITLLSNSKFKGDFLNHSISAIDKENLGEVGEYENLSDADLRALKLNLYLNNGNKNIFYAQVPTQADRQDFSTIPFVRNSRLGDYGIGISKKGIIQSMIIQDLMRIKKAKNDIEELSEDQLIEGYHFKKDKDNNIVFVNEETGEMLGNAFGRAFAQLDMRDASGDIVFNDEVIAADEYAIDGARRLSDIAYDIVHDPEIVTDSESNALNEAVNKMTDAALEYFNEEAKRVLQLVTPFQSRLSQGGLRAMGGLTKAVNEYVFDDFVARNEIIKLTRGSKAYHKNLVDLYKRMGHLRSPGRILAMQSDAGINSKDAPSDNYKGKLGLPEKLNTVLFEDVRLNLGPLQIARKQAEQDARIEGLAALKDILQANGMPWSESKAQKIIESYLPGEIEGTDALGIITLDTYRLIQAAKQMWTPAMEDAYWAYKKAPVGAKKFVYLSDDPAMGKVEGESVPILPLKGYFEDLALMNNSKTPISHKNHFHTIIEEYTKDFPEMDRLRSWMEDNNVHIANFVSGSKLAKNGVKTLSEGLAELETTTVTEVNSRGLRFPQEIPYTKDKTKVAFNRQLRKNSMTNVYPNNTYVYNAGLETATPTDGETLLKIYHGAIEERLRREVDNINKSLGVAAYREALESGDPKTFKEAKLKMLQNVRNILNSEIQSRNLPEVYSRALQIIPDEAGNPSFAIDLDFPVYGLKFQHLIMSLFNNNAYKMKMQGSEMVQIAQIGGHALTNELKFYSIEEDEITGVRLGHAQVMIKPSTLRNFGIDPGQSLESINEELRRIIAYRIPHQEKLSTLMMNIVGFLPENYEKSILLPAEITKLTGADFDVDKLFVLFPEVENEEVATREKLLSKNISGFDPELALKLQTKLEKLYPEIKLNITSSPIWEYTEAVKNQRRSYNLSFETRQKLISPILETNRKIVVLEDKDKMGINTTANVLISQNTFAYVNVYSDGGLSLNLSRLAEDVYKEFGKSAFPEAVLERNKKYVEDLDAEIEQLVQESIEFAAQKLEELLPYYQKFQDPSNFTAEELFQILTTTKNFISFDVKSDSGEVFTYSYFQNNLTAQRVVEKIDDETGKKYKIREDLTEEDLQIEADLVLKQFSQSKERVYAAVQKLILPEIKRNIDDQTRIIETEGEEIRENLDYEHINPLSPFEMMLMDLEMLIKNNLIANGIINEDGQIVKPFGFTANKLLKEYRKAEYAALKNKQDRLKYILANKEEFAIDEYEQFDEEDGETLAPIPGWFLNAVAVEMTGKYFNEQKGFAAGMIKGLIKLSAQEAYDNLYDYSKQPSFYTLAETKDLNALIPNKLIFGEAEDLTSNLFLYNQEDKGQILGQANIEAATVLIDAVNQKQDTLPHEYAHHYIAWFREAPIVQEAIKQWGSEEALVQAIGEQVVRQEGEAYGWWNKFVQWIMDKFRSLSGLSKRQLVEILTDAFLTRQDPNQFTPIESSPTIKSELRKVQVPYNELASGQVSLSEMSMKQLNNIMLDSIEAVGTNPAHILESLAPMDEQTLKSVKDLMEKEYPELVQSDEFSSSETEIAMMRRNQLGNALRGLWANFNAGISVAQYGNISINPKYNVVVDGVAYSETTFSRENVAETEINDPAMYVNEMGSRYLSSAVDAAKEMLQYALNDTKESFPVRVHLLTSYPDEVFIARFLNTPIIKDLTDTHANKYDSDPRMFFRAFNEVAVRWKVPKINVDGKIYSLYKGALESGSYNLNNDELIDLPLTPNNLTDKDTDLNRRLLINYRLWRNAGQEKARLFKAITPDSLDGIGTIHNIESYMSKVSAYERHTDGSVFIGDPSKQYLVGDAYGLSRGFYNMFESAQKTMADIFPVLGSEAVQNFKVELEAALNTTLTSEQHRDVSKRLQLMMLAMPGSPLADFFSETHIDINYNPKVIVENVLADGKTTIQISTILDRINRYKNAYPGFANNPLIAALSVGDTSTTSTPALNLDTQTLITKDDMALGLYTLMYNAEVYSYSVEDKNALQSLGEDIAMHFILQNGMLGYNFAEIIPTEFWTRRRVMKYGKRAGQLTNESPIEFYRKVSRQLSASNALIPFMDAFIAYSGNMYSGGSALLNSKRVKKAQPIMELEVSPYDNYVRVYNQADKQSYIYKRFEGNKFKMLAPFGDGRNYFEIFTRSAASVNTEEKILTRSAFPFNNKFDNTIPLNLDYTQLNTEQNNESHLFDQEQLEVAHTNPTDTQDLMRIVNRLQTNFRRKGVGVDVQLDPTLESVGVLRNENGKLVIYLNPSKATQETVFHEFAHVFIDTLGVNHPLVQELIAEAEKLGIGDRVRALYTQRAIDQGLTEAQIEEKLAKEIAATIIGLEGAKVETKEPSKIQKIINRILRAIAKLLGITNFRAAEVAQELWDESFDFGNLVDSFSDYEQESLAKENKAVEKIINDSKTLLKSYIIRLQSQPNPNPVSIKELNRQIALLDNIEKFEDFNEFIQYTVRTVNAAKANFKDLQRIYEAEDLSEQEILNGLKKLYHIHSTIDALVDGKTNESILKRLSAELQKEVMNESSKSSKVLMNNAEMSLARVLSDINFVQSQYIEYGADLYSNLLYKMAPPTLNMEIKKLINNIEKNRRLIGIKKDRRYEEITALQKAGKITPEEAKNQLIELNVEQLKQRQISVSSIKRMLLDEMDDNSGFSALFDPIIFSNDMSIQLHALRLKEGNQLAAENTEAVQTVVSDAYLEFLGTGTDLNPAKTNEKLLETIPVEVPIPKTNETQIIQVQALVQKYLVEDYITKEIQMRKDVNKKYMVEANDLVKELVDGGMSEKQAWRNSIVQKLLEARNKEINAWYKNNSTPIPKAEEILKELTDRKNKVASEIDAILNDPNENASMNQKLKALNSELADLNKEISRVFKNGQFRGKLAMPNDNYINPKYKALEADPKAFKYYNAMLEVYKQHQAKVMGGSFKLPINAWEDFSYALPSILESTIDSWMQGKGITSMKNWINDTFFMVDTDTDFGALTDLNGEKLKTIPVFFSNPLEANKASKDVASSIIFFSHMANMYEQKSKLLAEVMIMKDLMNERGVIETTSSGIPIVNEIARRMGIDKAKKGTTNNRQKQLNDFVDMYFFGERKKSYKGKILGKEISIGKITSAIASFTALNTLGLNYMQATNQAIMDNYRLVEEAGAGEFITAKGLLKAKAEYIKHLGALKDVGSIDPKSPLAKYLRYVDAFQSTEELGSTPKAGAKVKKLPGQVFMGFQTMAEAETAVTRAIAVGYNIKVKLENGKMTNLYDAYMNNEDLSKAKRILEDGTETTINRRQIANILGGIFKRTNQLKGEFNKVAAERIPGLDLVLLFRRYMVPSIRRRFGHGGKETLHLDAELGTVTQGMYISFANYLFERLKAGIIEGAGTFKKLSDMEKANVKRTMIEAGGALLSFLAYTTLANMDDDEENDTVVFWAYQMRRLQLELTAFNPISFVTSGEALRLLKSPTAGVRSLSRIQKLIKDFYNYTGYQLGFDIDEKDVFYQRSQGNYEKGDLKLEASFDKFLIGRAGLLQSDNAREALKWFNQPPI